MTRRKSSVRRLLLLGEGRRGVHRREQEHGQELNDQKRLEEPFGKARQFAGRQGGSAEEAVQRFASHQAGMGEDEQHQQDQGVGAAQEKDAAMPGRATAIEDQDWTEELRGQGVEQSGRRGQQHKGDEDLLSPGEKGESSPGKHTSGQQEHQGGQRPPDPPKPTAGPGP